MSETMAQITQKCGVLCLSEDPQNVLMWSHYADNHAGVCFGFEASPSNPFFGRAQQVLYSQSYPVVNIILDHSQSYHEKSVLTKADFWAYEKEWRIIEHEKGAGVYAFAASHLEEIIFGLNAQPTDKRAVKEALANLGLHPQIRQAVKHATEFRIELVNDDA